MTEHGTVIRYSGARGFGWIAPEHGGKKVYFHIRNVASTRGFSDAAIQPGERVAFKRTLCAKGWQAKPVRIVRESEVAAL